MKKYYKEIIIVLGILVLIGGISTITLYYKKIKDIEKHYNQTVKTTTKTVLYSKERKKLGIIAKNFSLSLEKRENKKDEFFKIKNTNLYIYYKDIKKDEKQQEKEVENKNHLVFNKNIQDKNITFYKENKEALTINEELSLPIEYMDDKYYYVTYLNKKLQVKKEKTKTIAKTNTEEKESEYISIINYPEISNNCKDENCTTNNSLKENLNYLKENNYYTINLKDYKAWLKGNIRLKEKAILLISSNITEEITKMTKEYNYTIENIINTTDLKFNDANDKSTKENKEDSINTYKIKNTTNMDTFKKMVNGEKIIEPKPITQNTSTSKETTNEQRIAVLNYHFFYDEATEQCNENICLQTTKFREQLDYLKNNGYKTLTMEEFTKWMYKEIELPEKSVLITIDDGAMGTSFINGNKLIPILEEYKMHATLFLITAWWDKSNYQSKYLDVESHGDDIHITGACGKAKIHCLSKDELITDFRTSINKLNTNKAFCYPFYTYNNTAIEAIKELGFKVAFAGGGRKAKQSDNKYLIPRYPVHKTTSMEQFISWVS